MKNPTPIVLDVIRDADGNPTKQMTRKIAAVSRTNLIAPFVAALAGPYILDALPVILPGVSGDCIAEVADSVNTWVIMGVFFFMASVQGVVATASGYLTKNAKPAS
jgi:hypothetical protein